MNKIILGLLILLSCGQLSILINKKKINRIIVSLASPIKMENNKCISDTNRFYINFMDEYRIYEFPRHIVREDSNKIIYDSIKFNYFIYDTSKKFGYLIKEIDSPLIKKVNADSILKSSGFGGGKGNLFEVENSEFQNMISSQKIIFKEVYEQKSNVKIDSTILYFDKNLNDVQFSWSALLDKKYDAKLYKIEIYLKHDIQNSSVLLPEKFFVNTIEIKKDTIKNISKILTMFEKYKSTFK